MKQKKLVCGIGINDAGYVTQVNETVAWVDGKRKQRMLWLCPFYRTWKDMLQRCYSGKSRVKYPTYAGCSVVTEWHRFSVFKAWMEKQDWEGNQLDKDLLQHSNKVYGPEHCIFVSRQVNMFMLECSAARGDWPLGVFLCKKSNKFHAKCSNPFTKKRDDLGLLSCPNEAHQAWLKKKREHAIALAALQTDARIAKALLDRYASDEYTPLHE